MFPFEKYRFNVNTRLRTRCDFMWPHDATIIHAAVQTTQKCKGGRGGGNTKKNIVVAATTTTNQRLLKQHSNISPVTRTTVPTPPPPPPPPPNSRIVLQAHRRSPDRPAPAPPLHSKRVHVRRRCRIPRGPHRSAPRGPTPAHGTGSSTMIGRRRSGLRHRFGGFGRAPSNKPSAGLQGIVVVHVVSCLLTTGNKTHVYPQQQQQQQKRLIMALKHA